MPAPLVPTYGERNHNAKLTAEQVIEMRRLYGDGWDCGKLGSRFGISQRVAWKICHNQSWKHLLADAKSAAKAAVTAPAFTSALAKNIATRRIPEGKLETYKKCFELRNLGYLYDEIGEKLGISYKTAQVYARAYGAQIGGASNGCI